MNSTKRKQRKKREWGNCPRLRRKSVLTGDDAGLRGNKRLQRQYSHNSRNDDYIPAFPYKIGNSTHSNSNSTKGATKQHHHQHFNYLPYTYAKFHFYRTFSLNLPLFFATYISYKSPPFSSVSLRFPSHFPGIRRFTSRSRDLFLDSHSHSIPSPPPPLSLFFLLFFFLFNLKFLF